MNGSALKVPEARTSENKWTYSLECKPIIGGWAISVYKERIDSLRGEKHVGAIWNSL